MKKKYYRQSGMTLIELVVVLGLLAAMATYALVALDGLSDRSRVDTTNHRIEQIRKAVAGDGIKASRFVSDMGRLPDVVGGTEGEEYIELFEDAKGLGVTGLYSYVPYVCGQTFAPTAVDADYGWNGPYLEMAGGKIFDGFGERFEIQTLTDNSWHCPSGPETGILAVRSLGRDGTVGPGLSWADNDIESTGFDAMVSAKLVIRVLVRGREIVDAPAWTGPKIVSPLSSATTAGTYSAGDIFLSSGDEVFRCKSNVTLTGTGSATWKTSFPGEVTTVTDGSNNVDWEFLGNYHEYMSGVTAVVFEPDTTGASTAVHEESVSITSGVVGTVTLPDLTSGIRWLIVYGGLIGQAGTPPPKANCYSSGLQCIELEPEENFITVLLTTPLN